MDILTFYYKVYLLVLLRFCGIFFVSPIFNSEMISVKLRMILAMVLTIMITPIVYNSFGFVSKTLVFDYLLLCLMELCIGGSIGLFVIIFMNIFFAVGFFCGNQIGLGMEGVLNIFMESSSSTLNMMFVLMSIYIFFILDGHIILVNSVVNSFEIINYNNFYSKILQLKLKIIFTYSNLIPIAFRISIPIVGTLLCTSFMLGILNKFSPQVNIFMLSFSLYIIVGMYMLYALTPNLIEAISIVLNKYLYSMPYLFN